MKIIFFIPRMGGGGAERVVANISNELDIRGHEIVIYTPLSDESFYKLNPSIKIITENYKISKRNVLRKIQMLINGVRLFFAYEKRMRVEMPDIVISFLTDTNILALMHKHRKYKLIVSERADPTRRTFCKQKRIKKLYRTADVLVCQSQKVKDYFAFNNCEVIPNPVDVSILPELFSGEKEKKIVAVGRLSKEKNFESLIVAFSKLIKLDSCKDYILEIYGEGSLHQTLQDQINDLSLENKIFLKGARKDVLECIKTSSLFVMSSIYEGFPNALLEAMAIGLPVICTDFYTGTAQELVKEENGILVPVNDTEALLQAMKSMILSPEKLESCGKKNVLIRNTYSITTIVDKWETLFKQK